MKTSLAALVLAVATAIPPAAQAHDPSTALSAVSLMPLASVVGTASVAAGASVVVPVALSTAGAVLVVKAVEVGARSTIFLLERTSDAAQASVEILHRGVHGVSLGVGSSVTVSVLASGVVLSAAGEALAFLPNALGRALLYNEQITR